MNTKAAKIGLTVLVLAGAFSALLATTLRDSMQYYKYVDEVADARQEWHGKTLQVHGYVVPGSIAQKPDTLDYRFHLQRNGKEIEAFYSGVTPDTFKADAEVVLTGRFTERGFEATNMTAKCPSKYEEAPAGAAATRSS
jgi:cytochrome c-type biogenesis protein CcmE